LSGQCLISVLIGQVPVRRPIWFMRQAGRFLPEYRNTRQQAGSFLNLCYSPKLAAEVTLQPLKRFDIDAAIIFADILVVPHAMGNGLSFVEGEGPVLETVRSASAVSRLSNGFGSRQFLSIAESVATVKSQLNKAIALIGFCGAPWTVASYMVEGGSSDRERARVMAYQREAWFLELIHRLVESSIEYLCLQIEAGADVVQIFDSWAGELTDDLFQEFCVAPVARIVAGVKARHPNTPAIVFAKGVGARHLEIYDKTGCQAVGIEAECQVAFIKSLLPASAVVQGNLDPLILLCSDDVIVRNTEKLVRSVSKDSHIFNLGHGIKPQTDPNTLVKVIDTVRLVDGELANG
jgi:uroporphyrinogen decarboxylase